MLEFKFRAWHKKHSVMISWELLRASMNGKEIWIPKNKLEIRKWGNFPPENEVKHILRPGNIFENPDLFLMQFSGFKDAGGRDIYQGDVISIDYYNPPNYAVDILQGGFCATHPNMDGYPIDLNHFKNLEDGRMEVCIAGLAFSMDPFDKAWKARI